MFGKRLVVVDADERNLRVLDKKLRDAGFEVHTASRSDEALEVVNTIRPDVVLTDFNSPTVDGVWLAKKLRSDDRTSSCGVIFLSRDGSVEAKQRALDAGCDEYLHKPIFVREIILHLGNLIGRLEKRDSPSSFSGSLSRLSVIDLLQLMEASRKTCIVNLSSDLARSGGFADDGTQGAIYFLTG
jgi:DNA-binding response OmpR family regulator